MKNKPNGSNSKYCKGKGSETMENKANWHHKVPSPEEVIQIKTDLRKRREALIYG